MALQIRWDWRKGGPLFENSFYLRAQGTQDFRQISENRSCEKRPPKSQL